MKGLSTAGLSLLLLTAASAAPADSLAAQSKFTQLDGLKVHYLTRGEGSNALVLVHGWSCDASIWKRQIDGLGDRLRVIAIDLPGHGESDKPKIAYTMELYARAIDAVLGDAGVDRAVLVGHSNGTPAVRQFYRKFSEKTLGLIIVDGPLRPMADKAVMEKFLEPMRHLNHIEARADFISHIVQPIKEEALRKEIKSAMLRPPQHVVVSEFEAVIDPAIWEQDKIMVPTLLILAKQPAWSGEYEQFVRDLVPNLDYQIWEGVSHFIMVEKPQEFNEAVLAFLEKNNLLK